MATTEKPLPQPPAIEISSAQQRPPITQRITSLPADGLVPISSTNMAPAADRPSPPPSPGLGHIYHPEDTTTLSDDDLPVQVEDLVGVYDSLDSSQEIERESLTGAPPEDEVLIPPREYPPQQVGQQQQQVGNIGQPTTVSPRPTYGRPLPNPPIMQNHEQMPPHMTPYPLGRVSLLLSIPI